MAGRDLSAELYGATSGETTSAGGRDLSSELYGKKEVSPSIGKSASFGAGIGLGVGQSVLGAQQFAGHLINALGTDESTLSKMNKLNAFFNQLQPSGGASDTRAAPSAIDLVKEGLMTYANKKVGSDLIDDANQGLAKLDGEYQPYRAANPKTAIAGNMLGAAAATYPLSAVSAGSKALTLAKLARGGATAGAVSALASPVESDNTENARFFTEKAKQAALGAAVGGLAGPVFGLAGRAVNPRVDPDVKMLMANGVIPTPGQILGGAAARTEEKMTSLPLMGDMIKNSQQRALEDFNRAVYARTLDPIGAQPPTDVGRDGVLGVKNAISSAYNDLLPKLQFKADKQFSTDLGNLSDMVSNAQTNPEVAQQFNKVLQNDIISRMSKSGSMDGKNFKDMESALTQSIKKYGSSQNPSDKDIAAALNEVLSSSRNALARSNPQHASDLARINQAFANYARVRDAASRIGAADGVFTAAQLQSAVRGADKSAGKGGFATGNALMQDLSEAGKNVLGSKYPDSGTAGRLGVLTLPAAVAAPIATGATVGALGLGMLPYTKLGQKLSASLLTSRPDFAQPVSKFVTQGGLLVAPAVTSLLGN